MSTLVKVVVVFVKVVVVAEGEADKEPNGGTYRDDGNNINREDGDDDGNDGTRVNNGMGVPGGGGVR